MRKNWKKFLALACAATMLVPYASPVTALADFGDSYLGEGAIENDNSILPNITNVVLSTINDTTYNFRVDPDGLLHEFDETLYDDDYMFFENIGKPLELKVADTYSFFVKSMVKYSTATNQNDSQKAFLELATAKPVIKDFEQALDDGAYYVWQPTDDMIGFGQYVQITSENYTNFVTITPNATDETKIDTAVMDTTPKMSEGNIHAIWDGEIYTTKYTKTDATNIVSLFNTEDWSFDESVYVGAEDNDTNADTYYSITTVSDVDAAAVNTTDGTVVVNYTPATSMYKSASLPASITNKSTFDIAVTANVQVTGGEGLNFVYAGVGDGTGTDEAAYTKVKFTKAGNTGYDYSGGAGDANIKGAGADDKANVALVIADVADASNKTFASIIAPKTDKTTTNVDGETVKVTAEANAYYVLKGSGSDSHLYTLGEIEEATLSNVYHRYLTNVTASNTASFVIGGVTDTRAYDGSDADNQDALVAAWDKYITDLSNGIATRPQVDVVYTFSKVTGDANNETFTDLDTNTYAKSDNSAITTGAAWVNMTSGNKTASVVAIDTAFTYGTDFSLVYYPSTAEVVSITVDGEEAYGWEVVDNVITFNAVDSSLAQLAQDTLASGSPATAKIVVTITDDTAENGQKELTEVSVTVNGAKAGN